MEERISGLHHVTAIAGDPQPNVAFYTGVLGLRLVKQTVNFDDPRTYHLYYGDAIGSPGTILTFFAWPGARRGRQGVGQASALALAIPSSSLGYWIERLIARGIAFNGPDKRFGESVLVLRDPDGLPVELIAQANPPEVVPWDQGGIPREHVVRGVHTATLWIDALEPTAGLLTEALGFHPVAEEAGRVRYTTASPLPGHLLDVQSASGFWPGEISAGTIHHLAWRTASDGDQQRWRERLEQLGLSVSPVLDRYYFHSIYFREPGNVLFEIATDLPGFAVDEPVDTLGRWLQLPSWLEPDRDEIERTLPPIRSSHSGGEAAPAGPELDFTHRFVPAADRGQAPTLLLLHGTGGDETDLLQLGHTLAPGANLLSPRGRLLEQGMPRFFRRLAEGVFDREDLLVQTHALADFIRDAAQRYGFDSNRVVAVGYSNGANIAASVLLLHPHLLAAAVLYRPMVPLEPDLAPDLSGVPVLIAAARQDALVPSEQTERLAALLEGFGARVKVVWHSGGHALAATDLEAAREWLAAQPLARPSTSLPPSAGATSEPSSDG